MAASGTVSSIELTAVTLSSSAVHLDELVARQRKQTAFRRAVDRVTGAPDTLQERGDTARRADLADEIDVADVDAELERCGGDERFQLAVLQALLGVEALLFGEAAVMRADMFFAQAVGELTR